MAQTVQIYLEDDLDGGPAAETLSFALTGREYAIDLSATNAEKLRQILRLYATAGRRTTRGGSRSSGIRVSGSNPDTAKIRAWAKENGHAVSNRGRIHQHIRDAYYAAR